MSRQKKIQLENGTILFLGAAAFILLAASLFPSSAMSQKVRSYLEMNRMVERAFAVMLLVLSTQLMKRKRTAWEMTMAVLTLSLLRGLEEIIHTGLGGPKFIPAGPGGCLFHPFVEQKRFLLSGL